jgi:hypothetical protein
MKNKIKKYLATVWEKIKEADAKASRIDRLVKENHERLLKKNGYPRGLGWY